VPLFALAGIEQTYRRQTHRNVTQIIEKAAHFRLHGGGRCLRKSLRLSVYTIIEILSGLVSGSQDVPRNVRMKLTSGIQRVPTDRLANAFDELAERNIAALLTGYTNTMVLEEATGSIQDLI
jgi:hypothetical protein